MTTEINVKELYSAGAHFGHRSRYWNPKLAPYIYGKYHGIHIIDLDKTLPLLKEALSYLHQLSAKGSTILFVGTKRAASTTIKEQAERCEMPYVDYHWSGGTLTNYRTIRSSINRYKEMKENIDAGYLKQMSKKEAQKKRRLFLKMKRSCQGISTLNRIPDALFVVDVGYENIAVQEAVKLNIPVIGIVDTNSSLDGVDYIVPANDDSLDTVKLCTTWVADAIIAGSQERKEELAQGAELNQGKVATAPIKPLLPPDSDDKK